MEDRGVGQLNTRHQWWVVRKGFGGRFKICDDRKEAHFASSHRTAYCVLIDFRKGLEDRRGCGLLYLSMALADLLVCLKKRSEGESQH